VKRGAIDQPSVEARRGQWLKGVLDLCVLAELQPGEAYGYEIARQLEAAGLGPIHGGTLYPLLSRPERDGLVATTWRANDRGPDRKYYQLSDLGRSTLNDAAKEWSAFAGTIEAILEEKKP
jgi:PadR family transcriptional regulator PadR